MFDWWSVRRALSRSKGKNANTWALQGVGWDKEVRVGSAALPWAGSRHRWCSHFEKRKEEDELNVSKNQVISQIHCVCTFRERPLYFGLG